MISGNVNPPGKRKDSSLWLATLGEPGSTGLPQRWCRWWLVLVVAVCELNKPEASLPYQCRPVVHALFPLNPPFLPRVRPGL